MSAVAMAKKFADWMDELEDLMDNWEEQWESGVYGTPIADPFVLKYWKMMFQEGLSPLEAMHKDQDTWG